MKEDVWKQDIGQWVERKGRCNWVQQRHPPPPPPPPLSSARPAARAGFIPSDFEERQPLDMPAMPSPGKSASAAASTAKRWETGESSLGNMRWVTMHGVSAGGIFDLREYFDVKFGRTVDHVCPEVVCDGALNWLHVKFEDPTAAARAVFQSPIAIPSSAATRAEEVVGVVWCSDTVLLEADRVKSEGVGERDEADKTRTAFDANGKEEASEISNAAGVTPCGADRLRRNPYNPNTFDANGSPDAFMVNTSSDEGSLGQKNFRSSRGFVSVVRDALRSPWSASYRDATESPNSVRNTHSHAEIPRCLSAARNSRHETRYRQNRAIPVWPLSGNISVLSVFRADKSQLGLAQRVWQALRFIALWISSLLTGSLSTALGAHEAEEDFAFGWTATVRGIDSTVSRHETLLRARHFGSASRVTRGSSTFGEVTLAHWVPCRWYERGGVRTIAVLLVLCLLVLCLRSDPRLTNVDMAVRLAESVQNAEKAVSHLAAEAGGDVQLQGTLFAHGNYGSDAYHARTL